MHYLLVLDLLPIPCWVFAAGSIIYILHASNIYNGQISCADSVFRFAGCVICCAHTTNITAPAAHAKMGVVSFHVFHISFAFPRLLPASTQFVIVLTNLRILEDLQCMSGCISSLIDWISDTRSQGYRTLQSLDQVLYFARLFSCFAVSLGHGMLPFV